MRLSPDRIAVTVDGGETATPLRSEGPTGAGPLEITVEHPDAGGWWRWSVANRSDDPVSVRSVSLVWRVDASVGAVRMFRNGYQSWSPTGSATFGVDTDPSRAEGAVPLVVGMHHADAGPAWPGELRSELVTVLADQGDGLVLAGFAGGWEHDGTLRLRPGDGDALELWAEAFLGDALLASGERWELHAVTVRMADAAQGPSELLERWAADTGARAGARTGAPYQVGWCSWYHYFHDVTEADVRSNLARVAEWPFRVFQVDDGYQAAIGDWLVTNRRFPAGIDGLAALIAATGSTPGLWLAPFLAGPSSALARAHPDWLARHRKADGSTTELVGMVNPGWGGATWTLDTTHPGALEHLEAVAAALVDAGFPYLKLDFTYAPALDGVYADPSRTPAQRVRAGFEAIRRGVGEQAFLLGCGAPLGAAVGIVDGMRIGADVAPHWHVRPGQWRPAGYEEGEPATVNAWRNTLSRSFLHRRFWLNDPDCLMLRTRATGLSPEAARAWAYAVGVSGGMALVSDDLELLGPESRALLDEVLELGRAADDEARTSHPARCDDLLDAATPTRLRAASVTLVGDPEAGAAALQPTLM